MTDKHLNENAGRSRKEWTPSWLASTAWGKTLYAVDEWLDVMCQPPAWPEECDVDLQDKELAEELHETIRLAGGRADGLWSRVMLETKRINQTVTRAPACSFSWAPFTCTVHDVGMAVLGANCVDLEDGSTNRSMNVNDNAYEVGRLANILTNRYDDVARLFPAYERIRQLSALLYALVGLKKAGFKPSPDLAKALAAALTRLEALPEPPLSSIIAA